MSEPLDQAQNENPDETQTDNQPGLSFPNDANVFAAIRCAVNSIENLALEAYWWNDASWEEIKECLNTAGACLNSIVEAGKGNDDCPWSVCGNGACRPVCMK